MTTLKLDAETGVRQDLGYETIKFNQFFLGHTVSSRIIRGIPAPCIRPENSLTAHAGVNAMDGGTGESPAPSARRVVRAHRNARLLARLYGADRLQYKVPVQSAVSNIYDRRAE
ncbi:hypothetical protein GCM10019059_01030 [Camelimonas fluminis]|nr:hypothetical protein GCM10019059_01030 [Camelimonas fluminis]